MKPLAQERRDIAGGLIEYAAAGCLRADAKLRRGELRARLVEVGQELSGLSVFDSSVHLRAASSFALAHAGTFQLSRVPRVPSVQWPGASRRNPLPSGDRTTGGV